MDINSIDYICALMQKNRMLTDHYYNYVSSKINDETRELLQEYTNEFKATEMLCYLIDKDHEQDIELERQIHILEKAIKLYRLPNPITVYRGTTKEVFETTCDINQNHFRNKSFMSTSLSPKIAKLFSEDLMLEISLPKDFPALWLQPFSVLSGEQEVLISKDIMFDITDKVTNDAEGDYYHIIKAKPSKIYTKTI